MIYKGKEMTFKELSKMTGIKEPTLTNRYQRGLRDDELTDNGPYHRGPLYINGVAHKPTNEDKKILRNNRLNKQDVQDRLDEGWDYRQAIELSHLYVMKDGGIHLRVETKDAIHYVPESRVRDLEIDGLSQSKLIKNLKSGNTLEKIVNDFYESEGVNITQGATKYVIQDRLRENRKRERELEKQRKEQERLQMIENAKVRSKWFEHLAANDIFPKKVVR